MKKASIVLLVILLLFFSAIAGYLIGHRVTNNGIVISYKKEPASTPTEEYRSSSEEERININTASVGQLLMLPSVGETLAKRIVEYRDQYGKFYSVEDLLLVKGFGEKKLEALREYITVGG